MATKIQKKLNWTRTAIKIFWNCFCLLHSRRSARGSISKASVTVYRQGNTMTSGWRPSDPRVQVSGVLNPSAFLCVPNEVYSNEVMSVLWLCVFPPSSPVLVAFQLPYPRLQRPSEQQSQLARVILFFYRISEEKVLHLPRVLSVSVLSVKSAPSLLPGWQQLHTVDILLMRISWLST